MFYKATYYRVMLFEIHFFEDGTYVADYKSGGSILGYYEVCGRTLILKSEMGHQIFELFDYDAVNDQFVGCEKRVMTEKAADSGNPDDMRYRIIEPHRWLKK